MTSMYTVTVATSDVAGVVASLPAAAQGKFSDTIFIPSATDATTGVLQVDAMYQPVLDAIMQQSSATRAQLVLTQYAANARWVRQTGGIVVNAMNIATDSSSIALINGAVTLLNNNASLSTIGFKTSTGWVDLTRAQMLAIGVAVGTFYQECFAAERAIDTKIANSIYTTTAQIDAATDWPSNTITTSTSSTGA